MNSVGDQFFPGSCLPKKEDRAVQGRNKFQHFINFSQTAIFSNDRMAIFHKSPKGAVFIVSGFFLLLQIQISKCICQCNSERPCYER